MTTLDERIGSAVDGLRAEVLLSLDEPHDIANPPRRRRSVVVAAVAAAVVVVLLVVTLATVDFGSTQQSRDVISSTGLIRPGQDHFRLGWIPKGMELQVATEGSSSRSNDVGWDFDQEYIRYDAARTRADSLLSIRTGYHVQGNSDLTNVARSFQQGLGYAPEDITVRGHPTVHVGTAIAWYETPNVIAAVNGPLEPDALVSFVDQLVLRPDGKSFDPGPLPAGFEPLVEGPGFAKTTADSLVWYGGAGSLKLFVAKDPTTPLAAGLADTISKPRLVRVGPYPGLLEDAPEGQRVTWDLSPSVRVDLTGEGPVSYQDLMRAARSLTSMSDTQWQRYGAPHGSLNPNQRATRKGITRTTTTPNVAPANAASNEAASSTSYCASSVSNRSGRVVGCLALADAHLTPPERDAAAGRWPYGEPVYDLDGHGEIVGYLGTLPAEDLGIGFVPAALAPKRDQLVSCNHDLVDPTAKLSNQCRQLLVEQGVPRSQIQAR